MSSLWSPNSYVRAWRFAAEAHHGQQYPGTELPYLLHLGQVCAEVQAVLAVESGRNGDFAVQCALLHDVIEDTDHSYAEIATHFGEEVAKGVLALTKDTSLPKEQQMPDSLSRILQRPIEIAMVKLADRIANLSEPPRYWSAEKCQQYHREAKTIYDTLHHASPTLAQRLAQRITAYERYCQKL